jgi:hypothetical protein
MVQGLLLRHYTWKQLQVAFFISTAGSSFGFNRDIWLRLIKKLEIMGNERLTYYKGKCTAIDSRN